jgi:hypothetical protein
MNINFDRIYTRYVKYRIIIRNSNTYPYGIEKKEPGFFTDWISVDVASSIMIAENTLHKYIAAKLPPVGTVVKTYDESDLIVDKLTGIR